MSGSEETVREELERKQEKYELFKGALDDDTGPQGQVNSFSMLAKTLRSEGICQLLLDNRETALEKFAESVEFYFSFLDAITEYQQEIPDSEQVRRPTSHTNLVAVAILAGDDELLRRAIQRPLDFDDDQYLAEWGDWEFHHVLYYVKALAHTLNDDPDTARSYLEKLDAVDHDYENYDALHDALLAIVEDDREMFVAGLSDLLSWHDDAYGNDLSTATHFICTDATALLVLARREGMNVGLEDFDEGLRAYLPAALFE